MSLEAAPEYCYVNNNNELEDLKAFEDRLTEVVEGLRRTTMRWRILLFVVSVLVVIAAFYWLMDPLTPAVSLLQSFWNHPFFIFTFISLVLVLLMGRY